MSEKPDLDHVAPLWTRYVPSLLISCHIETRGFFHTCSYAQTYEAYSMRFRCTVWIPLPCKRWSCRWCADEKIKALAHRCKTALPNRLLTLTIDPSRWDDPRHAFDGTRRQLPELIRRLRLKFGEVEYLRVTELTATGWPHYHLLVRSGYLPHAVVRLIWEELTGAVIVDLRKVEDRFKTFLYLVKYLSKMHNLGWTERHVSYSKHFFKDTPPPKADALELSEGKVLESHPADLVYHQFRNSELAEVAWNVFTLNPSDELKESTSRICWPDPEPKPPPPPREPLLPPVPPPKPDPQAPLFPKNPKGVTAPGV